MLNIFLALLGSILTAVQTGLILLNKESICFNDGCSVVESFTKVPPFFFNLAGFVYFFSLFYIFIKARKGPDTWRQLATLMLLGGMAAEGVLVAFQHFIVNVFCSYCLIVFSFIVLLSLTMGFKQFLRGISAFAAVLIAFSVLQFSTPTIKPIETGTYGTVSGTTDQGKLVLLFSETCTHCEEIIDELRKNNSCEINFNPIGKITDWSFDGLEKRSSYDPDFNIKFLANLGLNEIPALAVFKNDSISVLRGKYTIKEFLRQNCQINEGTANQQSSSEMSQSSHQEYFSSSDGLNYLYEEEEDNCSVSDSSENPDC